MLMASQEPYMLVVQPDDPLISPREVDETFGTMACFHRRYALGDEHSYADKDDFLHDLFIKAAGGGEQAEEKYDRLAEQISDARAFDEALLNEIGQSHVVLPLYLYDHSGLTMNTTGFSCPWDSGQVGWIYVSNEAVLKEFGGETMTADTRQKAEDLLRGEVEVYDAYLRGECYGFELYKNGELSDSCWGFMGNLEDVCKDIAEYLPDECKGMTEHLAEVDHPASMIKTLLHHARLLVEQTAKDMEHAPRQQVIAADAR